MNTKPLFRKWASSAFDHRGTESTEGHRDGFAGGRNEGIPRSPESRQAFSARSSATSVALCVLCASVVESGTTADEEP